MSDPVDPPADPVDPPADPAPTDPPADPPADPAASKKVELTQAELDAMIAKASGRAAKDTEKRLKDEASRASLDEVERLKLEKQDADQKAADATARANARLVAADAKLAAQTAKVKSDRIDAFLKLVDLSGVEVDDDGNVDTKALKKLIDAGVKDYPEFIDNGTQPPPRGGGQHNGDEPAGRATSLDDAVNKRLAAAS